MLGTIEYKTYPAFSFSDTELNDFQVNGSAQFLDNGLCRRFWDPIDQKATVQKIVAMLKQSVPYTGGVPYATSSAGGGFGVNPFEVNVTVRTAKYSVMLTPAYYLVPYSNRTFEAVGVQDVLRIGGSNSPTGYIRSHDLYEWLLYDKWEAECKEN